MESKRRVLIVSYHFPPAGGVKIQRVVKLIKYLGENGWQPLVLAPHGETHHALDLQALAEVEQHTRIFRARALDPLRPLYAVRNWLRSRRRAASTKVAPGGPRPWWRRLMTFILFPDPAILWLPTALFVGYRVIQREQVDLILSTSPPFSAHLIARLLARLTRRPLVVDMRDLWVDNPFVHQSTSWHEKRGRVLERRVFTTASQIICATPALRDVLSAKYEIATGKLAVITNGYDPADFEGEVLHDSERFTIVHGGSLLYQSGRDQAPLTKAMLLACEQNAEFARRAHLVYFGAMDAENYWPFRRLSDESIWKANLEYCGSIPHGEAVASIRAADLLVFLGGFESSLSGSGKEASTETHSIAAKLFEYMAAVRPILLIAQECPTVDVAIQSGLGIWCESYEPQRIAEHLLNCFRRFAIEGECLPPNHKLIAGYSRRRQATSFAKVFERAISRNRALFAVDGSTQRT